jgi:MFS family permease
MKKKQSNWIAAIGVAIEYYDFIIYGLMGTYLSDIFFQGDASSNRFYYFAIFSLGYIARPFGGTIFGLLSDRYGRKRAFSTMMLISTCSTLLIGLLPTDNHWLNYSVFLLISSRILQGIAIAGELPNASTMLHETNDRDPMQQSFILIAATCGNLFALLLLSIVSYILSKTQMVDWGWRIPFIIGAVFGGVCFYVRRGLKESEEYLSIKDEVCAESFFYPLKELITKKPTTLLFSILLSFCTANFILLFFYMPTYLSEFFFYKASDVYRLMTLCLIFSSVISYFLGRLMRKVSVAKVSLMASILILVISYPILQILLIQHKVSLFCFLIAYQFFTSVIYLMTLVKLSHLFEVKVRNTSIAFCYNVGFALASTVPSLLSLVIKTSKDKEILLIYLPVIALLHTLSVVVLKGKENS